MPEYSFDVAIIGAGTAGIAAYRAAVEAGADAVLIERGPGGTTCARVGCMPSKLLIAAGEAAHAARQAGLFGVRVGEVRIDGPAVLHRVRAERDRFVSAVFDSLDEIPDVRRIAGEARFLDARTLAVGPHKVAFSSAVIATGSSPAVPKLLRGLGDRVLTTDTIFEITDLPDSLAVLGGGPVGVELAQAMARLGVAVTVIDTGSTLAGLTHPDLVQAAAEIYAADMTLLRETEIERAEATNAGVRLAWRGADGTRGEGCFASVLSAAGRPPNLAGLDLAAAGLDLDDEGLPRFDPRSLVCHGTPLLIAGDANALRPILHEASRQGTIAGRNAAALARGQSLDAPESWTTLAMVFTHPQTARVGAPYDDGAEDRVVGTASFCDQGRARIEAANQGGIRLWGDRAGRLLGGELIGPEVEHLAHILADAIAAGRTVQDLLDRPVYHPTVEEGLQSALTALARAAPQA
ncbi:dihydrolipoyl dehydrogenase [Methylobacterium radiodurans]|uniref:Dihydrolipoyl dehydrogenase n=1 Tax=Methylobacterium radiodurans TaxID=2202828 RepID=A0A2U8VSN2_9HYPH|nr:dihydrolipoyl dehydrogenase [Methylobacterium radiodurans]AWN36451.1 dihydrolipoyl dehydrogenase [Methylobacterium radiodurans]